jgi:spermidine synthase
MRGPAARERLAFAAALAAAVVSGAAALSNEVIWSRLLVVPIGCSADATAIVLAAFMLGMAVGSRIFGGLADGSASPLKWYVLAEQALAASALIVPAAVRGLAATGWPFPAVAAIAFAIVFVPATLMGASLPALVRGFQERGVAVRLGLGPLYAAGTLGGAIGAAVAGYWAIPAIGLRAASFFAGVASFSAALIVILVARALRPHKAEPRAGAPRGASGGAPARGVAAMALLAAAVGGFAMLGLESVASRLLTFVFGHDTYAFAALLVVVLVGLGLGGALHRPLASRDPVAVTSALLAALALALVASYTAAAELAVRAGRDPFGLGAVGSLSASLEVELLRELLFAPLLVLLPSIAAGALLPAACAMFAGESARAGGRIGTALLVNGVASAAGAIGVTAAGIPAVGIQRTLGALAALSAIAAIVCALGAGLRAKRRRLATIAVLSSAALVGVAALPPELPKRMFAEAVGARHQEIEHYEEGRTGTVAVIRNRLNGERELFMNAVNEVTTRLVHDQSFKLLGHLAPLLRPGREAKTGLMICFGAGVSAGAALTHPFERLDIVELSSAIPRAADHFEALNHGALRDPRLHLHIDDGRHFLAASRDLYDAVIVDSTHPKAVDSWALYTVEFYREVRAHLQPRGIAVQWVPLHGLSEREFKIIVRTFQEAFPEMTLWVNAGFETYGQAAYAKLVGSTGPLEIDPAALAARLRQPKVGADLEPYGMGAPEEILDSFLAGPDAVRAWTAGLPVQADDRPFLSYITAFSSGRRMETPLLNAARSPIAPLLAGAAARGADAGIERARDAEGFVIAGLLDQARAKRPEGKKLALFAAAAAEGPRYYAALAKWYSDDPEKLFEIGNELGNLGRPAEALAQYDRAIAISGRGDRYRINRALALLDLGRADEAAEELSAAAVREPANPLAHYDLGAALLAAGRAQEAVAPLRRAIAIDPDLVGARMSLAEALRVTGKLDEARDLLHAELARDPWLAEARDMLGLIATAQREPALAIEQHAEALRLDPYRAEAHYNVGLALRAAGRIDAALRAFETAALIDPADADAVNELCRTYGAARRYDAAITQCLKALELRPEFPEAALNLGLAYAARGDRESAAKAFSLALELRPDLIEAKRELERLGAAGGGGAPGFAP